MKSLVTSIVVLSLASLAFDGSVTAQDFVVVTSSSGYLLNGEGDVEKTVPFMSVLDVRTKGETFFTVEDGLRIHRAQVHFSGDFGYMSENIEGARRAMIQLSAAAAAEEEPEKAIRIAQDALKTINAAFATQTPASAWFMQYLAYLHYANNDLTAANETLDAANSLLEEIGQQGHLQEADILNTRALVRAEEDDHLEAIRLLHEALLIVEADLGNQHLDAATMRENLSYSYESRGDTAQAVRAQRIAIRIKDQVLPASVPEIPASYKRLGSLCYADSQFQEAIVAFETAADLYRTHHTDRQTDIVGIYLQMGDTYELLTDFEKAEQSYVRGLSDLEDMSDEDALAFRKGIINRQGLLDFGREKYDLALRHYFDADKLYDTIFPVNEDGQTWENIGNTYVAQDDAQAAKDAFVKALKIYAQTDGENGDDVLRIDGLIGELDGARDGSLDDVVMVPELKAYMFDDDSNFLTAVPELTVLDWNARTDETETKYGFYTAPFGKEFGNIDTTQLRSRRMLPGYFDASADEFKTAVKGVLKARTALLSSDAAAAATALADTVQYCKKNVGEKSTLTLWVQMFQIRVMNKLEGPEAAADALSALRDAIQNREQGDYPIEMDAKSVAAALLLSMDEAPAAAGKFQAAREIAIERLGQFHIDVMDLSRALAQAQFRGGNIAEAEKEMRETLRIAEEIYPSDVLEVDNTRLELCLLLTQTDKLEEALERIEYLTNNKDRLDPKTRIMTFVIAGRVMTLMSRTDDAKKVLDAMLTKLQEMDADVSPPSAAVYADLGRIASTDEAWDVAIEHLTKATAIHAALESTNTFEHAKARHALGKAWMGKGDQKKAREEFVVAAETFAKLNRTDGPEAKETAKFLEQIEPPPSLKSMKTPPEAKAVDSQTRNRLPHDAAALAFNQGRFGEARQLYAQRLETADQSKDEGMIDRASAYLGLAKLSSTTDIDTFDTVSLKMAIDDLRSAGTEQELLNEALLLEVYVSIQQDESSIAIETLDSELLKSESSLTPKQSLTALCFKSRALTKSGQGKQAVETAKQAHQLAKKEFGSSHIYCHSALDALGHALILEGNSSAAAETFDASRQIVREYLNDTVARKSHPELVSFLSVAERSLHDAVAPLWGGSTMKEALTWVLNEKNLLAEFAAGAKAGDESSGKGLQDREQQTDNKPDADNASAKERSLFQQLLAQTNNGPEADVANTHSEDNNKLLAEQDKPSVGSPIARSVSVTDVRNALKPDELLIEFVYLGGQHDTYVAWMIPPTNEDLYVSGKNLELGTILDFAIDGAAPGVNSWIQDIKALGEVAATVKQDSALQSLLEHFWRDLAERIPKATKTIIFSLDGTLHRIPWAAMPTHEGRLLIEDYGIRFVSSGRELVQHATDTQKPGPSLILANPDFDAVLQDQLTIDSAAVRGFPREYLPATIATLPGTALEARAILGKLARHTGSPPKRLTGADATESAFFGFRRPRTLHIGTHSVFLTGADEIAQSRSFELSESCVLLEQKFHARAEFNPLSRCGLLLAGCNAATDDATPADSVLTGQEIVAHDMHGTELVVLSGCPSGLNNANDSDGPTLLPTAFRLAGAKTVVAPIWEVPDTQTTRLLVSFYENLSNGMSKTEALRQAQLSAIEGRTKQFGTAHPFFWAAFCVYGVE